MLAYTKSEADGSAVVIWLDHRRFRKQLHGLKNVKLFGHVLGDLLLVERLGKSKHLLTYDGIEARWVYFCSCRLEGPIVLSTNEPLMGAWSMATSTIVA